MVKVISWIMVNGATIIGCVQALIKAIKELITGIVNLLSLFMPATASANIVKTLRGILNKVDDLLETLKGYLVK